MQTVAQMTQPCLDRLTPQELWELGQQMEPSDGVPPDAKATRLGNLSDGGQRAYMLRAILEDRLDEIAPAQRKAPFDESLAITRFDVETMIDYLSEELSEEFRQLGADEFDGTNPVVVEAGYTVLQYSELSSIGDMDDWLDYFASVPEYSDPSDRLN